MKTASAALISFLASAQEAVIAELYTITCVSGTILRYTSLDIDAFWNGDQYDASSVLISHNGSTQKTGIEVSEMELTMVPLPGAMIDDLPWMEAVDNGYLDGATITRQRIFLTPDGMFGTVAN